MEARFFSMLFAKVAASGARDGFVLYGCAVLYAEGPQHGTTRQHVKVNNRGRRRSLWRVSAEGGRSKQE